MAESFGQEGAFPCLLLPLVFILPRQPFKLTALMTPGDGNVISWDIAPFAGRRTFTKAKVQCFDRKQAKFKTEEVERPRPAGGDERHSSTAADQDHAKGIAEGRRHEAEREGGDGTVVLDMTPGAQAEAMLFRSGTRAGADGTYRIVTVTLRGEPFRWLRHVTGVEITGRRRGFR